MIIGLSVQRVDSVLKPHTHRRSVRLGHFYPLLSGQGRLEGAVIPLSILIPFSTTTGSVSPTSGTHAIV